MGGIGRVNQFASLVSPFYNAINAGIIVKNISMDSSVSKFSTAVRALRWSARILSILSVGIFLLFAIGEGFNPFRFTAQEAILFLFFPFGVCLGMILAWRWEGLGGGITVASLAAFYLVHRLLSPGFPRGGLPLLRLLCRASCFFCVGCASD